MKEKKSNSKYEFKLNFKELVFFVIGFVCAITIAFVIGIWTAKMLNSVPSDTIKNGEHLYDTGLQVGEDDLEEESVINVMSEDDKNDDAKKEGVENKSGDDNLSFPGALAGDKIIPMSAGKPEKSTKKPTRKEIERKKSAKRAAAKKEKERKARAKAKAKSKKSAAASKPASTKRTKGGYTIQVVSLKNDNAAMKLVSKLERKGFDAYFTIADVRNKGRFYRVRVGNFSNKAGAKKSLAEVNKIAGSKGMIVKDTR